MLVLEGVTQVECVELCHLIHLAVFAPTSNPTCAICRYVLTRILQTVMLGYIFGDVLRRQRLAVIGPLCLCVSLTLVQVRGGTMGEAGSTCNEKCKSTSQPPQHPLTLLCSAGVHVAHLPQD